MKAFIVVLLLIFVSLAFGAEQNIPLEPGEKLERLDTVIQTGVGKVTVAVIRDGDSGSLFIDVYGKCNNYRTGNGAPSRLFKIGSVQKAQGTDPCGYTNSSVHRDEKHKKDIILVGFVNWMNSNHNRCPSDADLAKDRTLAQAYVVDLKDVCLDYQK